ncbi:hypothetical protein HMPREF3188_00680 [Tissierellia bacterium KA00581]|nr:hypothetical protein HMPREF3188_00680 [Tissierellia bacterium KA00581]
MKRYKLKHKYLKGFEFSNYNYLNYDKLQEQFYLESEEETEDYQTIFSDEEIEKLVEKWLNLLDWIMEEVE